MSAEKVSWQLQSAEEAGLGKGERDLLREATGVRQRDTRKCLRAQSQPPLPLPRARAQLSLMTERAGHHSEPCSC